MHITHKASPIVGRWKGALAMAFFLFSLLGLHARDYKSYDKYPLPTTPYEEAVVADDGSTTFALWAPTAEAVRVMIYAEGEGGKPLLSIRLTHREAGMWTTTRHQSLPGRFYTFQVKHHGHWLDETPGISARAVGVNGKRGALISLRSTDPAGWDTDRYATTKPKDAIVYEMHHRDFSIHPSAPVREGVRGKFLALCDGASYLRNLGVTHVHILPSYDYGSVDETRLSTNQYNWGYDPVNYNVPDGSYSTDPYRPEVRIREFKEMVQGLHREGLALILDVVYNHVVDAATSNFERTVPGYFFRTRPDGTLANGSGCGNETASERAMMRRYMVESVKYWMTEYHVDGFRFDLMGIHDVETMRAIREAAQAINPNVLIYGEGWAAEAPQLTADQLAMKANMRQIPGVAAFSDELRDALRGPFSDDHEPGMLGGKAGLEESVKFGIAGCVDHPHVDMSRVNYSQQPWAAEPQQMMAYVSCHDDMCLVDRLKASIPAASDTRTLERLDMLAQTAVFTSQGIPFIQAGEEVMRDKKGVHNSYCSPDDINAIDWTLRHKHPNVYAYYRGLMQLRTAHPGFRLGSTELVRQHLEFLPVQQDCVVAYALHDLHKVGDQWDTIIVVLNARSEATNVDIPAGRYALIARDGAIKPDGMGSANGGKVNVPAHSALILAR